ncbi:MAG: hypothetical protein J7497_07665 [Chitinophagaceae bacterium]|nr:hypothetical protein [Chitinophagaceae bacterium]
MTVLAGKTKHHEKREIIRKILFKLHLLLQHDSQELKRRIAQLEIIGKLRDVQKIIIEEEKNMAITYNIKEDIRYQQGVIAATEENKENFTRSLLLNTAFSVSEISNLVEVSEDFVLKVKKDLHG